MYSKEVVKRLAASSKADRVLFVGFIVSMLLGRLFHLALFPAAEFPYGLRRALRSFQVDAADLLAALCARLEEAASLAWF